MRKIIFRALAAVASLALAGSAYAQSTTPISTLPSASTPLTGTELVPCVQGGVTKKCASLNIAGSIGYTPPNPAAAQSWTGFQTFSGGVDGKVTATGASTSRSLSAYFGDFANVLNYGADPTGTANSTSAFQAAFAANGHVFAPCGKYSVNLTWAAPSGAILQGAGLCSTLQPYTVGQDVLKVTTGGNFTKIADISVITTSGVGTGIEVDTTSGNLYLVNDFVGGTTGTNGFANGVLANGGANASGLQIIGGYYLDNAGNAINLFGTAGSAPVGDFVIQGANIGSNGGAGVLGTYASGGLIIDNFIWQNNIGISLSNSAYNWVSRNRITQSPKQGLVCANCNNLHLVQNQFYANSLNAPNGASAYEQAKITATSGAVISANQFYDWNSKNEASYHLTVDATSNNIVIEGNRFDPYVYTALGNIQATSSIYKGNLPASDTTINDCTSGSGGLMSGNTGTTTIGGTGSGGSGTTLYLGDHGYNAATGVYSLPINQRATVCGFAVFFGSATYSGTYTATLYKNGSATALTTTSTTTGLFAIIYVNASQAVSLAKGDAIDLVLQWPSGTANTGSTTVRWNVMMSPQ